MNRNDAFRTARSAVIVLCVAGAAWLAGCGKSGPSAIVVYSPHGKDLLEFCVNEFHKVHPEIDVQWLDMGSQDCLDRIRSERANPQADLWWGAPASLFAQAEQEHLLAPYAPSWKAAAPAETHSAADAWYGTFQTPEVIAYNTTAVPADRLPKDWDDLLRPEWQGKIVIREPLASGTMRTIFCAIIQREARRTGSIDSGFAWLQKLDANTHDYCADQTQLYLKLSRGEAAVTVWNMPDIMLQSEQHHYPFGYIVPAGGTPVLTDGIALVHGSPHAGAAQVFYEFVTSRDLATAAAQRFYRIPVRTDLDTAQLPAWMRRPVPHMAVDWSDLGAHEQEWMKRWSDRVKSAR